MRENSFHSFKLGYKNFIQLVVMCGYGLNLYYTPLDHIQRHLPGPSRYSVNKT